MRFWIRADLFAFFSVFYFLFYFCMSCLSSWVSRLRFPWCTSSLCSALCELRAALSASLCPPGSSPRWQGLAPLSLSYFHSFFPYFILLRNCCLLFLSVRSFICCLWLSSSIRNKLSCSCFAPCPCFKTVTSLPIFFSFFLYLSFTSEPLLTLSVLSPLLTCYRAQEDILLPVVFPDSISFLIYSLFPNFTPNIILELQLLFASFRSPSHESDLMYPYFTLLLLLLSLFPQTS